MSVPTYVFEPFDDDTQVMCELWADGTVTIATRPDASSVWGPKYEPIISDDGEHILAPEPVQFSNYIEAAKVMSEEHRHG